MTMLQRSLAGAALILALAVLRAVLGGALPRRAFAALWWAAVLRLLLPWKIPSRLSVYNLFAPKPQAAAPLPGAGDITVRPLPGTAPMAPAVPAVPEAAGPSLPEVSPWAVIWLAGAALLAAWFLTVYLRYRWRFRTSLPAEGEWVPRWQAEHPRISLRVSDRITGPLTYGLLRPVILLPKGIDRGDGSALGHILAHEYEHIRHLDGLTKLVLAGTLCVHWWNPAVWLMAVLANRDLELACDEAVVRRTGDPAGYARTLLAMEEARAGICPQFAQSPIEERIKAMIKFQNKRVPILAAACALLAALCVTTAFATSARETKRSPAEQEPAGDAGTGTAAIQSDVLLRGGEGGGRLYSVDGGKTWLSQEDYQARYGAWDEDWQVEWWTAEEYETWLEQEKKDLQDIIGSRGWTPSTGWFTWDRKRVDEAVALYEEILEKIKGGALYSRRILDRDGKEVEDVALGSGGPLDAFVTSTFDESVRTSPEKSLDAAELLKELEKFGVTGSEERGLTYQGRPVRTLVDGAAVEGGWSVRYVYRNEKGAVDLHTLRDRKDNGDGSYDPMGALKGVAAKGDPGFDQGLMDSSQKNTGAAAVTEAVDSAEPKEDRPGDGQMAVSQEAASAMGSETDEGTPLPEMFDKYKSFGLEYRETRTADGIRRNLFYQGKPVNQFVDHTPDGGVFTFGSSDQASEGLNVWTSYDRDGNLSQLWKVASLTLSEEEAAKPVERNALINGDFPKNSKGETYGNSFMSNWLGRDPDLVAARGTEGQDGYVRNSDISTPRFETAEEQLAWAASHPPRGRRNIPLYDFQGNEIGEFECGGSMELPKGISLEEAKRLVAAGGSGK